MRKILALLLVLATLTTVTAATVAAAPVAKPYEAAQPAAGCTFYSETMHNLCGGFRAYWQQYGGLAIFGFPITEEYVEHGATVQYFERARFEWRPGSWPERYDVNLGLLGSTYADQHNVMSSGPFQQTSSAAGCTFYAASGHNLCGGFRAYWEHYGGLAIFGYPISEELTENGMTVQYFERQRFEWQPGKWPERWDVLLGRLGANVLTTDMYTASLSGAQENPPVETEAFGVGHFALNYDQTELHYWLNVWDTDNITQAHIHWAPPGTNGSVVAWLYPDGPPSRLIPGTTNGRLAHGVISSGDLVGPFAGKSLSDLMWEIKTGNTYANVHTQQYAGGEIRGQLMPGGLMAHLSGSQENPNPVNTSASGEATFMVTHDGAGLYYRLYVDGLQNLTQAHIHLAPFGQNGDVVAWLYPSGPPSMLKPGVTSGLLAEGTITGASLVGPLAGQPLKALLRELIQGHTYANVHTQQYPGGEIRGQINMPGFIAHLSGDQEVPDPVETDATGFAMFALNEDGTALHYKLSVSNLEDLNMAHIHLAPAGASGGVVAWLYPDGPPPSLKEGITNGLLAEGTITDADLVGSLAGMTIRQLVTEMLAGNTYVNVHTEEYTAGEIRGQIMPSVIVGAHSDGNDNGDNGGEHQH